MQIERFLNYQSVPTINDQYAQPVSYNMYTMYYGI